MKRCRRETVNFLLRVELRPSQKLMDVNVEEGRVDMVRVLLDNGVYPTQEIIDRVTLHDDVDMVGMLGSFGLYPSDGMIERVIREGELFAMRYKLLQMGRIPPSMKLFIHPNPEGTWKHPYIQTHFYCSSVIDVFKMEKVMILILMYYRGTRRL